MKEQIKQAVGIYKAVAPADTHSAMDEAVHMAFKERTKESEILVMCCGAIYDGLAYGNWLKPI